MTDIFLSYAHEDHERVTPLVSELQKKGWSVWWDARIRTGVSFDMEIETVLSAARCVLVVWSKNSIDSQWVRSEAHEGMDRNILVPVLIDDVRPPMPFRQIQARELFNLPTHAQLLESGLLDDISRAIAGISDPYHKPQKNKLRTGVGKFSNNRRLAPLSILAAIMVVLLWTTFVPTESTNQQSDSDQPTVEQQATDLAARQRIIVANMQNFSGDEVFDESLDHAFRIGMGQSRIASVLSDIEIHHVLIRMKLAEDTLLNREIALEVALREQARAVILPSINRVGDTYVISVEIVRPGDGQTIFTDTKESSEKTQVISALGQLIVSVREQLGESLSSIDNSNLPLEKVTTANLEALKAYSTAINFAVRNEQGDPIQLLLWAVDRDPEFAMAHAKLAALYSTVDNGYKSAQKHLALALQHSDRLTERERVYIQASSSWGLPPAERVRAWKLVASLFPDEVVGHHNLAMVYWEDQNRFVEAASAMRQAANIDHPWQFVSMYSLAYILLGLGETQESLHWFETSFAAEGNPLDFGMVDVLLVLGRYDDAWVYLSKSATDLRSEEALQRDQKRIGLMLTQGLLADSAEYVQQHVELAKTLELPATEQRYAAALLAIFEQSGDAAAFESHLRTIVAIQSDMLEQDLWDLRFSPVSSLAMLGKIAARNRHPEIAKEILASIQHRADQSGFFFQQAYTDLLKAELSLADGKPQLAIGQVKTILHSGNLFQAHETLARAYEMQNEPELAIVEYLWMIQHQGQALAENMSKFYGREFNLLDRMLAHYKVARLYESTGHIDSAVNYYQRLVDQWNQSDVSHWALNDAKDRLFMLGQNRSSDHENRADSGL